MRWALLVLLAGCGLPPESQQRVADCSELYLGCVEQSDTMDAYRACRSVVDARCLGGADR